MIELPLIVSGAAVIISALALWNARKARSEAAEDKLFIRKEKLLDLSKRHVIHYEKILADLYCWRQALPARGFSAMKSAKIVEAYDQWEKMFIGFRDNAVSGYDVMSEGMNEVGLKDRKTIEKTILLLQATDAQISADYAIMLRKADILHNSDDERPVLMA